MDSSIVTLENGDLVLDKHLLSMIDDKLCNAISDNQHKNVISVEEDHMI